jgi:hypothetical protein
MLMKVQSESVTHFDFDTYVDDNSFSKPFPTPIVLECKLIMKTLINETQAIVQMEISQVLEGYPHHPHQQVFANPDRRQDLTAYVLNHVRSVYTSIDLEASHRFSGEITASAPTAFPNAVGLTIEKFIHQGIRDLFNQNTLVQEVPSQMESGRMASSWFG